MPKIVILKNDSGNSVEVKNLPIRPIADGTQITLTDIMTLEAIYLAASDNNVNSLGHSISSGVLVINDGTNDLSPAQAATFLSDGDLGSLVGSLEMNRVSGLENALAGKAGSPLTTVKGRFPTYDNEEGDLGAGKPPVGFGETVVTLGPHSHIEDQYLPERIRRYPDLPISGYTSGATISPGNANTYLDRFNVFDGNVSSSIGLSVTFSDATALPTKSDFSTDDDTIVIANFNQVPMTLAIIPGSQVWRLNSGTISGDITLPQFHYIQLSRLSGFSTQIYVMNFGIINFIAPGSSITILDFSIEKDVPLNTDISGSQTITFNASGVSNIERDDWGLVVSGRAGGVNFAAVTVAMSSPLLIEGNNVASFTIPTARTLSQDGDFYQISITYDSISPNVQGNSLNQWRIDAREADHPSQGTFKAGWLPSSIAISSFNSSTINSAEVYDNSDVQIGTGPEIDNDIPASFDVPGVDQDGKRLVIEVQDELGIVETIVENAGTAFQNVIYDHNSPLSVNKAMNSIKYSKTIGGESKNFTLIYFRGTLVEGYEDSTLVIHTLA